MRAIVAAGIVVASALVAADARAYHLEVEDRIVDGTARTVGAGHARIGLWNSQVGILDQLDVGTYQIYWALPIFNLYAKVRFYQDGDFQLSASAGVYYMPVELFWWASQVPTGWAAFFPIELMATIPLAERWSVHVGTSLNLVSGQVQGDTEEFAGAVAAPNLQVSASVEWRATRVIALVLTLRMAPWVDYAAAGGQAVELDPSTTATVALSGSLDAEGVKYAASAILAWVLSWDFMNVRIGAGWGSPNIPGVNALSSQRTLLLDFDVFVRF